MIVLPPMFIVLFRIMHQWHIIVNVSGNGDDNIPNTLRRSANAVLHFVCFLHHLLPDKSVTIPLLSAFQQNAIPDWPEPDSGISTYAGAYKR